jgi:hypothetical protein
MHHKAPRALRRRRKAERNVWLILHPSALFSLVPFESSWFKLSLSPAMTKVKGDHRQRTTNRQGAFRVEHERRTNDGGA